MEEPYPSQKGEFAVGYKIHQMAFDATSLGAFSKTLGAKLTQKMEVGAARFQMTQQGM